MDEKLYGIETIVDLYECDPDTIASEPNLRRYLKEVVAALGMVPYGEPLVARFGFNAEHTAGYSIVQLIETSSITGHFSESFKSAHINVFSCKPYDSRSVFELTRAFFGAAGGKTCILCRYGAERAGARADR